MPRMTIVALLALAAGLGAGAEIGSGWRLPAAVTVAVGPAPRLVVRAAIDRGGLVVRVAREDDLP